MKSILTPFQKTILDGICKEKFITDNFYMGGGTALAEFYLHHRYSEDFDFFTENEIPLEDIKKKFSEFCKKLGIKSVELRQIQSAKIFFLKGGKSNEKIKTDFNFFPFPKFGKPKIYKGLKVLSLLDIAICKLDTILTRCKARDFVDLYFIQKENPFDLNYLVKKDEEANFFKIDPVYLASRLLLVEDLHDYPKMVKPFLPEEMIEYFHDLAKSLKPQIVK